jgi:hypothetical protein
MAESTLSLKKSDLEQEIGFYLGYGRGAAGSDTAWTTAQQSAITMVLKAGLRQWYSPPPLEQGGVAHDWSFLKPWTSLPLASGNPVVPLPDDFGAFEGSIVVVLTGEGGQTPIDLVGAGDVHAAYADMPDTTGRPTMACEEPIKGTSPTTGQRFQVRVYPTPDQAYTLELRYDVLPDALSDDRPYVYGGSQHHESVLQSCLAQAELKLDGQIGVQNAKWVERLATSVSMDRKNKAQAFGPNLDRSDRRYGRFDSRRNPWLQTITFNGVDPG